MTYKEYDDTKIQSFEYETTVNSDGNILGVCELGKATIQLLNEDNEYSNFKGSWISTVHGSFYIYDVTPIQERVNIKLDCYDIKYKLDTKYDSTLHTFPCTLKAWRNSIFDACGVEYDNSDFPNSDLVLSEQPYVGENPSNRNVIALIAQAGASFVITDSNDKFYFSWFENTLHNVEDWQELTTESSTSNAINRIILGRGDVGDDYPYPENVQNPIEFRIDNNYILDPQDTTSSTDVRETTIIPIYNRINGFSYLIFNMKTQRVNNKLSIKLGQKVKFVDIWDNELTAYVMTKKITYLGGNLSSDDNYEITLSASEIKESSTELNYSSDIKKGLIEVSRKVDRNTGEIQDLARKIVVVSNDITGTGRVALSNAYEGILHKLSIKGQIDARTNATLSVGDNLNGKTLYFDFPEEGTTISGQIVPYLATIIETPNNSIIAEREENHFHQLCYIEDDELIDIFDCDSHGYVETSLSSYKLSDNFGTITSIDNTVDIYNRITMVKYTTKPVLLIDNTVYSIDLDYLNYMSSEVYDEWIYEDGKCKIVRRVGIDNNGDMYALQNEVVENRDDIILEVNSNSVIHLQDFNNATYNVSYLIDNDYTNTFANQVEVQSSIKQTADSINSEVSKKVGEDEVISKINQSAEAVGISANKIELSANDILNLIAGNSINLTSKNITITASNFSVDASGAMTSTSGIIGNWHITSNMLYCEIIPPYDYSSYDTDRVRSIVRGDITPTSDDYARYDFYGDGAIDTVDMLIVAKLVTYNLMHSNPGRLLFDTTDWFRPIKLINSSGTILASFGVSGVLTNS